MFFLWFIIIHNLENGVSRVTLVNTVEGNKKNGGFQKHNNSCKLLT